MLQSSSIGAIAAFSLVLLMVFGIWIDVANNIYIANFGYAPPASLSQFAQDVLTTKAGGRSSSSATASACCSPRWY